MSPRTSTGRKTAKKRPAKKASAKKRVAAKSPRKAAKKTSARKTSRKTAKKTTTPKKTPRSAAAPAKKRAAARKSPATSARTKVGRSTTAQAKTPSRPRRVSPSVAQRNFRKLLEAKQERVRQGPSYPAPNEFTGRHDADSASAPQPAQSDEAAGTSDSEVIYGDPAFEHRDARDRS